MHKGGGGAAPKAQAPIPPVSERSAETQYAGDEAMRAGLRKKGNRSTILGGMVVGGGEQVDKAFGQRTLLGSASN